ncbi:DUF6611 family protein [uncultured Microbacterium sp.]|uniref:DUF6611 family protein n=1 Tax=uncultured Microbacterium sp. TaxID=191216 RepID=UPI0026165831|nr:DUF6611 family protein [uncultured Microbacterium sp.]
MVRYYSNAPRRRDPWRVKRWGRVDYPAFSAAQLGQGTMRLIIFRPGTTAAARRWADAWAWLIYRELGLGFLPIGIIATLSLPREIPVAARAGIVAAVLLAATVFLWAKARPALSEARGVRIHGRAGKRGQEATITGDIALFEQANAKLDELDEQTDLTPVEYEAHWAAIYDWLVESEPAQRQR